MPQTYENMLFNFETTYRTDFRFGQIHPPIKTRYRPRPKSKTKLLTPRKDLHTLTDRSTYVPFNLFIKLKDVVRTNPGEVQQARTKPPDLEREEIQKTRPRLIITPAVSIDDVTSQETRQLLINDVYLTTAQKAMRDGIKYKIDAKKAPIPELPSPANPITLLKWQPPYVSHEWRWDSVKWDDRQLRAKCDPSKEFFLARQPKFVFC